MVQVAAREHDACDGCVSQTSWMQLGEGFELLANLGRSVDQKPGTAVSADGDRLLRARAGAQLTAPNAGAIRTAAVPLRKAATSSRAQDANQHGSVTAAQASACSSALGETRSVQSSRGSVSS